MLTVEGRVVGPEDTGAIWPAEGMGRVDGTAGVVCNWNTNESESPH